MPDIQMCTGAYADPEIEEVVICNARDECYRYTAKPSPLQAFGPPGAGFSPIDGCDDYIPNGKWCCKATV